MILGVSATVYPISIPDKGEIDLVMMVVLSAVLLPIAISQKNRIIRAEGVFLLLAYFAYTSARIFL